MSILNHLSNFGAFFGAPAIPFQPATPAVSRVPSPAPSPTSVLLPRTGAIQLPA